MKVMKFVATTVLLTTVTLFGMTLEPVEARVDTGQSTSHAQGARGNNP